MFWDILFFLSFDLNHLLPCFQLGKFGIAQFTDPLSVASFLRRITASFPERIT